MYEVIGYIAFVFIGFVLGVIGGGGSMLAVPALVYLFADKVSMDQATAYSLFIVGVTSLFGSYTCLKKGDFKLEALYLFAIPSLISIFVTRKFVMPLLPEVFFNFDNFQLTKNLTILIVFSALIIFASYGMIVKNKNSRNKDLMWAEFFRSPLK
ncbi:MAG: TSUP family transporter, partial [Bacteroidota bacterium]